MMACLMERRQWPRRAVSWSVRLSLGQGAVIAAKAVDASLHGLRLVFDEALAAAGINQGDPCGLEVYVADDGGRFVRQGHVCHIGPHGVGLAIREALPSALVPSVNAAPIDRQAAATRRGLAGFAEALRNLISAPLYNGFRLAVRLAPAKIPVYVRRSEVGLIVAI